MGVPKEDWSDGDDADSPTCCQESLLVRLLEQRLLTTKEECRASEQPLLKIKYLHRIPRLSEAPWEVP